jgi:hypothetical protein
VLRNVAPHAVERFAEQRSDHRVSLERAVAQQLERAPIRRADP